MGRATEFHIPAERKVYLGWLWSPPSFQYNGHRGYFPGGKVAKAWSRPLTSIYADIKNEFNQKSTPCISLHDVYKDNLDSTY